MAQQHSKLPDDPIGFIKRCMRAKKVHWTYHVNMRLRERFITRNWIFDSVDNYLPSYLVWARNGDVIFHILFAVDVDTENVRVITSYRPSGSEWSKDRRRRLKS